MPSWQAWISGDKTYGRTRLAFLYHEHYSSVVPWRVWEPTPAVQFHAPSEVSASKKPAVWAWNPNILPDTCLQCPWQHGCVAGDRVTVQQNIVPHRDRPTDRGSPSLSMNRLLRLRPRRKMRRSVSLLLRRRRTAAYVQYPFLTRCSRPVPGHD